MKFNDAKRILQGCKKNLFEKGVRKLAIFGSVARNVANATSDIDILIECDPKMGLFSFVELKLYLEQLLKCDVDLVSKGALHPALKKSILKEAQSVF